jgi:hypothetical protein
MLQEEALNNTNMSTLAEQISEGLDNRKTIGLAVGKKVVGFSQILPETIVSEQMIRANSASQDPLTALTTFSRNINIWLSQNPQPTPTPTPEPTPIPRPTMQPIEIPKTNEVPLPIWGVFVFVFVFVIVTIAIQIKKARDKYRYDSIMSSLEDDK